MRKTIVATSIVAMLTLAGCTGNNDPITPGPTVNPAPSISESTNTSEPETEAPTRNPEPAETTTKPAEEETVAPSPSSEDAAPPATKFAQRWGQRYPNIPEFAILKAANATCRAIEAAGPDWNDNALVVAGIESAVNAAGLSENDALEFAQDANQNYCSSVSNPT